jgi:colicin import membrane protein
VTAAVFEERVDPGRGASVLLSLATHLLLVAILVFGVRWQNKPAEVVQVELWEAPRPAPVVEPPKPEPKVEPPAPKPEPKIEKPDIVVEKAPPPKPKAEKKPEPKPVAKPEPLKPRVDEAKKRMQEQLAREQAAVAIDREQAQIREQLAREAAAAGAKAMADWMAKVRAKIRGNMVLPPDVKGNPEALFDVVQLPTGEVLSVKLRKSSGHAALDAAIERAILKSSPLPKPDSRESPPRSFVLKYNPLDPL